jgi:hypothetical protein
MRRLPTLFLLLLMGVPLWSQESFSLEGTVGSTLGTPETYSISMVGRLHVNKIVSVGGGVGLWNSGYTSSWLEEYDNQTATSFRLSDNQTVPSFQLNIRGETPLMSVDNKPLHAFIEPGLVFLPSTRRTITLAETYFTGTLNPLTNEMEYSERSLQPKYSNQLTTNDKYLLGWELKGGLSLFVSEQVACALSCAYQHIDLFQQLNTTALNTHETNEPVELQRFSPQTNRFQLQLSFIYLFPLK